MSGKFVQLKASAKVKRITPALLYIFDSLLDLQSAYANLPQLVITSVNDGKHVKNSRHYTDEAVDIRTHYFITRAEKRHFIELLKIYLGSKFTVLHESVGKPNEHIHVQVKKGTKYS